MGHYPVGRFRRTDCTPRISDFVLLRHVRRHAILLFNRMIPFAGDAAPSEWRETERRAADRFTIEREVKYRVIGRRTGEETGSGATRNMSSKGVLFETSDMLLPGRKVELQIQWPAQLESGCPLKLVARGIVVRIDGPGVAMDIQQYEFRTAKRS